MKVNFFIVGAPKAGTTSLYHYLNGHPEIEMSTQKETDYFSSEFIEDESLYYPKKKIDTLERYHSLFPIAKNKIFGEASVSYLFYNEVPKKINAYNSKAKIIIMLRNPVERAFSHYLMDYRLGLINTPFQELFTNYRDSEEEKLYFQQYINIGKYYCQIKRYLDIFDRKNIHIIYYYDFQNRCQEEVKKVFKFLGVDDSHKSTMTKHNSYYMPKTVIIRSIYKITWARNIIKKIIPKSILHYFQNTAFFKSQKPNISDSLRTRIAQLFDHDISKLEKLLDKDLSRWRK